MDRRGFIYTLLALLGLAVLPKPVDALPIQPGSTLVIAEDDRAVEYTVQSVTLEWTDPPSGHAHYRVYALPTAGTTASRARFPA